MKPINIIAVLLIIAGIAGFVFGGFDYSTTETVAEIGSLEIKNTDENRLSVSPYAAGAILATGLVLLVLGGRGKR